MRTPIRILWMKKLRFDRVYLQGWLAITRHTTRDTSYFAARTGSSRNSQRSEHRSSKCTLEYKCATHK